MQNSNNFEVKSKLDFQSQRIHIHFLAFEFQESRFDRDYLIEYFFSRGFNAFEHNGKDKNKGWQTLKENKKNNWEIVFRRPDSVREWRLVHFSGGNATRLYFLIKEGVVDFSEVFQGSKITRIDVAYAEYLKLFDYGTLKNFFLKTQDVILSGSYEKQQDLKFENNEKGLILRIGCRKRINFLRIYKKKNDLELRFEHELKSHPKLAQVFELLKYSQFQQLEEQLILRFLTHLAPRVSYCCSYTDWINFIIRPLSSQLFQKKIVHQSSSSYYQSDYMDHEIKTIEVQLFNEDKTSLMHDIDNFHAIQFLLLLKFLKNMEYQKNKFDVENTITFKRISGEYRVFCFQLRDFMQETSKTSNQYQMHKLKIFFQALQRQVLVTFFCETNFQSIIGLPLVDVTQPLKVGQPIVVTIWVAEELFHYKFPFILPEFSTNRTKLANRVWAYWSQIFTTKDIQKIMDISQFIKDYPSQLNSKQKQTIKKEFLKAVDSYLENQLIEHKFHILEAENKHFQTVEQLTLENINQGFVIYEKLNLNILDKN